LECHSNDARPAARDCSSRVLAFMGHLLIRFSRHKNENGQPALIADCPKNEFLKMLRAV
jgi:hypothetical protein